MTGRGDVFAVVGRSARKLGIHFIYSGAVHGKTLNGGIFFFFEHSHKKMLGADAETPHMRCFGGRKLYYEPHIWSETLGGTPRRDAPAHGLFNKLNGFIRFKTSAAQKA